MKSFYLQISYFYFLLWYKLSKSFYFYTPFIKLVLFFLRPEVLTQLVNIKIVKSDVVTQVQTQNLTVMCEFNLVYHFI